LYTFDNLRTSITRYCILKQNSTEVTKSSINNLDLGSGAQIRSSFNDLESSFVFYKRSLVVGVSDLSSMPIPRHASTTLGSPCTTRCPRPPQGRTCPSACPSGPHGAWPPRDGGKAWRRWGLMTARLHSRRSAGSVGCPAGLPHLSCPSDHSFLSRRLVRLLREKSSFCGRRCRPVGMRRLSRPLRLTMLPNRGPELQT